MRDYRKLLQSEGVRVPRWALLTIAGILILWIGLSIFRPDSWEVQRLDSPDGEISARLTRTRYARDHFVVHVREGWRFYTAYYSQAYPADYTVDHYPHLSWRADGERLYLSIRGRYVWGRDFAQDRDLTPAELRERAREEPPIGAARMNGDAKAAESSPAE